ncbi:MAG: SHOCT domain-containing protein [Bacteroidaceae bacterium]|nr:SHOCT domain-containing protein [Bacteroidaceae bacterium]
MKILKRILLWSLIVGAASFLLAIITKSDAFLYIFIACSVVFLIAITVSLFGAESIEGSEARSTYDAMVRTRLQSGYDTSAEIACSGKWHAVPSKDRNRLLFVKTDAQGFQEYEIKDFGLTHSVYDGNGMVAIDGRRKKLLLYNFDDLKPEYKVVRYSDLLSVSIVTDGVMVSEKSTARALGGALVGGALLGEAGAVVGGLSGSATHGQKIGRVAVKFLLRDVATPTFEILFLNMMPVKPSAPDYYKVERALKKAQEIKDMTSVVIDEVDRTERAGLGTPPSPQPSVSVADELTKLAGLKEQGILSEAEFAAQKTKLLS